MNVRLRASEFVDRLKAELSPGPHVGSMFDFDYAAKYCKTGSSEVWVSAQMMTALDDGTGFSNVYRQRCDIQIAVRIIAARHSDGMLDSEQAFGDLWEEVSSAICGWQPTGADMPMSWKGSLDGSPADSVMYSDLLFRCPVTFTRT